MDRYQQQHIVRSLRETNTRKVAILGSGIVSNLATTLLKDTIVLTKKRTPIFLDNVFIHDTVENRLMLMLFGIDFKSKLIPVYYYNFKTKKVTDILTNDITQIIVKEKMGNVSTENLISGMSSTQNDFRNLIFDEYRFIKLLTKQAESLDIFPYEIVEHKDFVRLHFEENYIDFEYLINTIPQPFFEPMASPEKLHDFKCQPLVFVTTPWKAHDSMTYSYNNCPWKRQFIKNNILCIEFNKEEFSEGMLLHERPELKTLNYKIIELPYGRIQSLNIPDTNRIKHIGRFAQWDHTITTEHSINKLINLNL